MLAALDAWNRLWSNLVCESRGARLGARPGPEPLLCLGQEIGPLVQLEEGGESIPAQRRAGRQLRPSQVRQVFLDVASLRSGQRWQEQLHEAVTKRDIFYLFWSQHAKESRWVDWEWRTALAARGIDFIDPVPLAPPEEVPPPRELAEHLHFNDWVLAFLRNKEAGTRAGREEGGLPPGAEPRLVVLRGQRRNVAYPIYEGLNFIGRADEKPVDIDLEDQEPRDRIWCSRQHALVGFEDGKLFLEDLNSVNGTYLNRTRVYPGQKQPLRVNDIIQIGTV